MVAKASKYKKILTKKLSSLVILLILLVMGVFAVVFNKFYISPKAMMTEGDGGSGGSTGGFVSCCTARLRRLGYVCKKNVCTAPAPVPVVPVVPPSKPSCSYNGYTIEAGKCLDNVSYTVYSYYCKTSSGVDTLDYKTASLSCPDAKGTRCIACSIKRPCCDINSNLYYSGTGF